MYIRRNNYCLPGGITLVCGGTCQRCACTNLSFKTVANPQSHAVKLTCFKLTYLTVFIRCSKTCKFGSYSPQLPIILLSMSEANICVSRNRERNGRCRCGWSDKNDALSKLTIDSLDDSQDSRSCNQIKKHKSL